MSVRKVKHAHNALRWTYIYNIQTQHFGRYMDGNTPFEKLKSLIPNMKEEIASSLDYT